PTLAGDLKRAGYRTGAFVGAFVLDARFGLNAGFEIYDDRVQGASANLEIVQRTADAVLEPASAWILNPEPGTKNTRTENPEPRTPNLDPRTPNPERRTPNPEPRTPNPEPRTQNQEPRTPNAERRTPNAEPRPWFTWVHLYDPHEPYTPPEPFASRYAGDPYSGEVAYADAALGRFFDRLRAGSLDRTLVVITADHGESLGD